MTIPDFNARLMAREQLDQPDLDGQMLTDTLEELERINHYLGNSTQLVRAVMKRVKTGREIPITIVDLGCGGGDVLRRLATALDKKNIPAKLIGLDANPNILAYANSKSKATSFIRYQQADILAKDFTVPACDLLICSHFLYHFTDKELHTFLRRQQYQISDCFLFSELQRSRLAWFLFRIIARLAGFSAMTTNDGQLAIRRAFRRSELEQIFHHAGFYNWRIRWKWAFRYLIELYPEDKTR